MFAIPDSQLRMKLSAEPSTVSAALRKIAVVTPYYRESLLELSIAHQSVMAQDVDVTHIMVADGHSNTAVGNWKCQHIILPSAHNDAGNFARGIGALHAFQNGAEYVCFLDADNWLEPNHASSLYKAVALDKFDISISRRTLRRLDGSILDHLDPESDGVRFADTGTMMLSRNAIEIAALWATLPVELSGAGDQFIWAAIKQRRFKIARTNLPTMNYKTKWAAHYSVRGEEPPNGTVDLEIIRNSERHWQKLSTHEQRRILSGTM